MNWYLKVLRQYADFSGRARRKEFWIFSLFNFIFLNLAMILDNVLGITFEFTRQMGITFQIYELILNYGWFYLIYCLAIIIPGLAVGVRRLHDIGKSGWNCLIGLIPFFGWIILLVWFCKDSQAGKNKWGSNPKTMI